MAVLRRKKDGGKAAHRKEEAERLRQLGEQATRELAEARGETVATKPPETTVEPQIEAPIKVPFRPDLPFIEEDGITEQTATEFYGENPMSVVNAAEERLEQLDFDISVAIRERDAATNFAASKRIERAIEKLDEEYARTRAIASPTDGDGRSILIPCRVRYCTQRLFAFERRAQMDRCRQHHEEAYPDRRIPTT